MNEVVVRAPTLEDAHSVAALLQSGFRALWRGGHTHVGLEVDSENETEATRLYEREGWASPAATPLTRRPWPRARLPAHRATVRIVQLQARIEALPLAEPFVIARNTTEVADVVWVELEHDGEVGYGEAAPIDRYDESPATALAYLGEIADSIGDDAFALDEIMRRLPEREYAARAAVDTALHDLCGKLTGIPVWRLLGLRRSGPPSSWTIGLGDPDEMARKSERVTGLKGLKLKLGGRDGLDADRVAAVRAVWPGPIRVDVNEAWEVDEALETLPRLAELAVEYCEQPLPAGDPAGARLKAQSPLPIYVDEDCHTL